MSVTFGAVRDSSAYNLAFRDSDEKHGVRNTSLRFLTLQHEHRTVQLNRRSCSSCFARCKFDIKYIVYGANSNHNQIFGRYCKCFFNMQCSTAGDSRSRHRHASWSRSDTRVVVLLEAYATGVYTDCK